MPHAIAPLVLIVDDDEDTRYVYGRLLRHRGFETIDAADARRGLELARDVAPALVIMDYLMPGLDGWEATRRLKADPITASIPVISVTAYAYPGIESDARAAGSAAFIEKPCDPFDVIRTVVRLIGPADDRVAAPRVLATTPRGTDAIVA